MAPGAMSQRDQVGCGYGHLALRRVAGPWAGSLARVGYAWFAAVSAINSGLRWPAATNRLAPTEVSVVQRNARAWPGHDNNARPSRDAYASADFSEILDDDEAADGQLAAGDGIQIAIVRPRTFRDAATVGEYFRQDIPVLIDLENMSNAEAWRIIDFISGLILGLCGDIERVSRRTFLIVPAGAAILTKHKSLTEEGFFNQA
jgi:cell division inhibitor SepF